MVHHRGFYFDPPERSKDRHEVVWFPPIAEAITYHYVHPEEMYVMTNYANERWQWQPTARNASHLQHYQKQNEPSNHVSESNSVSNEDAVLGAYYMPLRMEFIERVKASYQSGSGKKPIKQNNGWFWS